MKYQNMRGFQTKTKGPDIVHFATVDAVSWWGRSTSEVVYRPHWSAFWRLLSNGEVVLELSRLEDVAKVAELLKT